MRSSAPGTVADPDDKMGYSMRTGRYRYVEWRYVTRPGTIAARELYDPETDPRENTNLADDPKRAALVRRLHEQLEAGWRGSLPPGR